MPTVTKCFYPSSHLPAMLDREGAAESTWGACTNAETRTGWHRPLASLASIHPSICLPASIHTGFILLKKTPGCSCH